MTDRHELARQALVAAEAAARARRPDDEAPSATTPSKAQPSGRRLRLVESVDEPIEAVAGGSRRRPDRAKAQGDREPDPYDVARRIVLRQLTMGPKSRAQLESKLASRGCAPEVVDAVLSRMEEVGLVDDIAFAQMLVASKQASKGLAKRGLAQELRDKGIDNETVSTALAGIGREDEVELARRLATRRMASMHGLAADVQARRLAAMLARKGYPPSVVYSVVRDVVDAAPEHRRD
jgi:regulatory protein